MNPFTRLRAWWRSYREALALGREAQHMARLGYVREGVDWVRPLTPEEINAILTDTRSVDE